MESEEIKAGDVVYLRSHPRVTFTVGRVLSAGITQSILSAECYYFDPTSSEVKEKLIPVAALKKVL